VSNDGSRVFFTGAEGKEEASQEGNILGQVFLRENPTQPQSPYAAGKCSVMTDACTVMVSASQRKVADPNDPSTSEFPNGVRPARYWGASADGSRVFFTSRAELTDNANTGPADSAANLYEYDVETGVLSDLTVDTNAADANGASVLGLVTASEDGAYVYFVADGDLAEGAVSGHPNLYLRHAGEVTFIATLAAAVAETYAEEGGDSEDWRGTQPQKQVQTVYGGLSIGPEGHTVRVTPDGTHLAFESERSLTGYDNEPVKASECQTPPVVKQTREPGPCREVYLYDAVKGALVCASCDPTGARPTGPAHFRTPELSVITPVSTFYEPRNFSDDGSRLFFQSPDALVPQDSNGVQDVYEYHDGHVYPISDVAGNQASFFLDASATGNDVFIATSDQLVPGDTDTRIDVYDARVGGGYPVSVSPPACTNGDSCKPTVSAQPGVFGTPASATFSGAGNLLPAAPAVPAKPKSAAQLRAERLGKALKMCRAKHNSHRRAVCERRARAKYGPVKAKKARRAGNNRRAKS
jgi:hypothetical protein